MRPRIHVITLAVTDLERALEFYRRLGLESPGVGGTEFAGDDTHPAGAVVMFQLEGGLILALYPRTSRPACRRSANSASAMPWQVRQMWTHCWAGPRRRAPC
jgi:hypothetical protein